MSLSLIKFQTRTIPEMLIAVCNPNVSPSFPLFLLFLRMYLCIYMYVSKNKYVSSEILNNNLKNGNRSLNFQILKGKMKQRNLNIPIIFRNGFKKHNKIPWENNTL